MLAALFELDDPPQPVSADTAIVLHTTAPEIRRALIGGIVFRRVFSLSCDDPRCSQVGTYGAVTL